MWGIHFFRLEIDGTIPLRRKVYIDLQYSLFLILYVCSRHIMYIYP